MLMATNEIEGIQVRPALLKKHKWKKPKGISHKEDCTTSTDAILKAIEPLSKRVDDRMEEVNKQLQQHSSMLSTIAKSVQFNSEELKQCKTKIKEPNCITQERK